MSGALTRRRTGYAAQPHPACWQVSASYQHGTRLVEPGQPLKISGERGQFRFLRHVVVEPEDRRRKRREWIDVVGGTPGVTMFRSFRPDRIRRVLRAR